MYVYIYIRIRIRIRICTVCVFVFVFVFDALISITSKWPENGKRLRPVHYASLQLLRAATADTNIFVGVVNLNLLPPLA